MLSATYLFTVGHKAASMFIHKALTSISGACGFKHFSNNNAYGDSLESFKVSLLLSQIEGVNLVGPVRDFDFPGFEFESHYDGEIFHLFQSRDPLDTAVSQYFSHGWIHVSDGWSQEEIKVREDIQTGRINIYEYVEKSIFEGFAVFGGPISMKRVSQIRDFQTRKSLLLTYEDFYYNYDNWAEKIADFLPFSDDVLRVLKMERPDYAKLEYRRVRDRETNPLDYVKKFRIKSGGFHIRSAEPGDHKIFLSDKEISSLRARLETLGQ